MRIHSNTLTQQDFRDAATAAGITIESLTEHGSRSRKQAHEVYYSGSGRRGGQWGSGDVKSATWDEWGIALALLFERDAEALVPHVYLDAEDFHWVTGHRYTNLRPEDQHKQHRWQYAGRAATGSYSIRECACGAVVRVRTGR